MPCCPIHAGPNWPLFEPVDHITLAELQLSHGVHICPSEREGFGHYINEARAASALVITTNHPPMNELITAATGVLIPAQHTFSHTDPPVPALGKYGNISASVSPEVGQGVDVVCSCVACQC